MKNRKRAFFKKNEEENFWPAFTDIISTIALILFFLMLISYVQNIVIGKQYEITQEQLEKSRIEIKTTEKQLADKEEKLQITIDELEDRKLALKMSKEEIETQEEIIAISNEELAKLRSKLEGIAVLRLDVLNKVKGSLENELGKKNKSGQEYVSIADNGNIIINEALVFDTGSYTVKEEGKQILDKLAKGFEKVLADGNIRSSIDSINIQGHTDARGGSVYNRDLSSKRAASVVNYMMSSNPNLESSYGSYFAASGYSEFRPISSGESEADYRANRRIEISVSLKDGNIQNVIDTYLKDSKDMFE
ncbi:MAG: OmpA family protein [Firmicutes bacterium]|jgi:chemotaxis protein MotB|nr:OmpA family protein [Bacillota bacterium]